MTSLAATLVPGVGPPSHSAPDVGGTGVASDAVRFGVEPRADHRGDARNTGAEA